MARTKRVFSAFARLTAVLLGRKANDVISFFLAGAALVGVLVGFDRIFGPTLNTEIGLTYIAMFPATVLWAARSWYFWWETSRTRRPELGNYRLAVSAFLTCFSVFLLDTIRLRLKIDVPGVDRSPSNLITFWIRAALGISMYWGTTLLYLHYIARLHRLITRRGPPPKPPGGAPADEPPLRDPYLDDPEETIRRIQRRREMTDIAVSRLRALAAELDRIADNVQNDPEPATAVDLPRPHAVTHINRPRRRA